jgi:hypothetical protein
MGQKLGFGRHGAGAKTVQVKHMTDLVHLLVSASQTLKKQADTITESHPGAFGAWMFHPLRLTRKSQNGLCIWSQFTAQFRWL